MEARTCITCMQSQAVVNTIVIRYTCVFINVFMKILIFMNSNTFLVYINALNAESTVPPESIRTPHINTFFTITQKLFIAVY